MTTQTQEQRNVSLQEYQQNEAEVPQTAIITLTYREWEQYEAAIGERVMENLKLIDAALTRLVHEYQPEGYVVNKDTTCASIPVSAWRLYCQAHTHVEKVIARLVGDFQTQFQPKPDETEQSL